MRERPHLPPPRQDYFDAPLAMVAGIGGRAGTAGKGVPKAVLLGAGIAIGMGVAMVGVFALSRRNRQS